MEYLNLRTNGYRPVSIVVNSIDIGIKAGVGESTLNRLLDAVDEHDPNFRRLLSFLSDEQNRIQAIEDLRLGNPTFLSDCGIQFGIRMNPYKLS